MITAFNFKSNDNENWNNNTNNSVDYNKKPIKTLNIKDISSNDIFKINDNENIEINNTNSSVDCNNQRITKSIAKITKKT